MALRSMIAPVGDRVVASLSGSDSNFVGVISDLRANRSNPQPAGADVSTASFALYDGRSYRVLVGNPIPRSLSGHKVRVSGTMQKSGTLSVNAIQRLD
jgi:hypothetical protein